MPQLFSNNAFSTLASSITNVATTLSVATGHGNRFPVVASPDIAHLTLQDAANNIEIVRVTARAGGADSMTIVRAQEGTTARGWTLGDIVELRITQRALAPLQVMDGAATAAAIRTALAAVGTTDIIAIAQGGTGAASAAAARTALGVAASGANADITSLAAVASINGGQLAGLRNKIINGAMQVWQRGNTFNGQTVSGAVQYAADRWLGNRAGDVVGQDINRYTITNADRTAAGNAALPQFALQWQRSPGNTSLATMAQYYSLETVDSLPLAGQRISFSFFAKNGANYSGGALTVAVSYGTGTDQRSYAMTGSVQAIGTTQALTTNLTRYTFTSAAILPITATQVGVILQWTPTGTAGADDSIYFTAVQLEAGATATLFEYLPVALVLALCQRYLPAFNAGASSAFVGSAYASSTTGGFVSFTFKVPPRVAPTGATVSNAAHFEVLTGSTGAITLTALAFSYASFEGCALSTAVAAGQTAGSGGILRSASASGQILFTGAEL